MSPGVAMAMGPDRWAEVDLLVLFGLGALAYYLFAGRAPACDRASLRDRLTRDGGLDLLESAGQAQAPRPQEGWPDERLLPLVAGPAELQPWVDPWHGEVDPTYGVSLAAFLREQLTNRAARVGRTLEQLKEWQPAPTRRRRSVRAGAGRGSSADRVPHTLLGSDAGRS